MNQRKNTTMQPNLLMAIILPLLMNCTGSPRSNLGNIHDDGITNEDNPYYIVSEIPMPEGFSRITVEKNSFAEWLRTVKLKKDRTVYKFDGTLKANQSAQYAVLDVSVGTRDLQQCADAVMRLRAEYLFSQKRYAEISFSDNAGTRYNAPINGSRSDFDKYLEKVFSWCGSLSLEKQLKPVHDLSAVLPGDVLIKGGSPGHAAIVMDVGVNDKGEKIYLLANSYMPAQDIHVVLNPVSDEISPWYSANNTGAIMLPEWTFTARQLRRW